MPEPSLPRGITPYADLRAWDRIYGNLSPRKRGGWYRMLDAIILTSRCLLPILIALVLSAVLTGQSKATPLPYPPIALAEQFWAPYGTVEQTCAHRLDIHYYADLNGPDNPFPGHPAWTNIGANDCIINVWDNLSTYYTPAGECAVIAHEIGHNTFGLQHVDDPTNIMDGDILVIPNECQTHTQNQPESTLYSNRPAPHRHHTHKPHRP